MIYKNRGTCSTGVDLEIENGVITRCEFIGGCRGNTQGVAKLVTGRDAREVMELLSGIQCRNGTSCPDQLSRAIGKYLEGEAN